MSLVTELVKPGPTDLREIRMNRLRGEMGARVRPRKRGGSRRPPNREPYMPFTIGSSSRRRGSDVPWTLMAAAFQSSGARRLRVFRRRVGVYVTVHARVLG